MAASTDLPFAREHEASVDVPGSVLQPGKNCWKIGRADRAALLVDAAEYYAQLDASMRSARRSIQIVGWDFDGRIRLRPEHGDCLPLGPFLRQLVEQRPELEIRILVWSVAVVHTPSAPLPLLLGANWQDHPRIDLRLDREHPFYASHHQKIVTVDDAVAFCGGIDLTVQRWDTAPHRAWNRHRRDPDGTAYPPVHDVQMVLDGEPARALAEIARDRWRRATCEQVRPVDALRGDTPWPKSCTPDFRDVDIAVARTMPAWRGSDKVEEIAALTGDLLLAARHKIYIEAQYFCGRDLRGIMSRILSRPTGPEILAVVGRNGEGVVEHTVMGRNRDRLMRRVLRIDAQRRLKIYSPVVSGTEDAGDIKVHAKLMIVDDRYLRVGSANLNNRSMGLDTECDIVVEANNEAASEVIAGLRDRLLAEHLAAESIDVHHSVQEHGLIAGVDRLNARSRGLRPLSTGHKDGPEYSVFGTAILDPRRPFGPAWLRRWWSTSRSISAGSNAARTRTLRTAANQGQAESGGT